MIIQEIETTTIRTDQESFVSHHIEITHNGQIDKIKTAEIVHQKIKSKSTKKILQKKQAHTSQVLTLQKLPSYN